MWECIDFSEVITMSFLDVFEEMVGLKSPDVCIGKSLVFENGFGARISFCFITNGSFNVYAKELKAEIVNRNDV